MTKLLVLMVAGYALGFVLGRIYKKVFDKSALKKAEARLAEVVAIKEEVKAFNLRLEEEDV